VDHRWVGLVAPANGVRTQVGHLPAMELEYHDATDGPRVRGRRENSCPEDGDVVIMDQRPASVAGLSKLVVGHSKLTVRWNPSIQRRSMQVKRFVASYKYRDPLEGSSVSQQDPVTCGQPVTRVRQPQ